MNIDEIQKKEQEDAKIRASAYDSWRRSPEWDMYYCGTCGGFMEGCICWCERCKAIPADCHCGKYTEERMLSKPDYCQQCGDVYTITVVEDDDGGHQWLCKKCGDLEGMFGE